MFAFVVSFHAILGREPVEDCIKKARPELTNCQFIFHCPNENGRNSFAVDTQFQAFFSLIRELSTMCDTMQKNKVHSCIILIAPIPEYLYNSCLERYRHNIHIANLDASYPIPEKVSPQNGWKIPFNIYPVGKAFGYTKPVQQIVKGKFDTSMPSYTSFDIPAFLPKLSTNPVKIPEPSFKTHAPAPIIVEHESAGTKRPRTEEQPDSVSSLLKNIFSNLEKTGDIPKKKRGIEYGYEFYDFLDSPRKYKSTPRTDYVNEPNQVIGQTYHVIPMGGAGETFRITKGKYRFNYQSGQYDLPYTHDKGLTFGLDIILPTETVMIPYNEDDKKLGRWIEWVYCHRGRKYVAGYFNSHDFSVPLFMTFYEPTAIAN